MTKSRDTLVTNGTVMSFGQKGKMKVAKCGKGTYFSDWKERFRTGVYHALRYTVKLCDHNSLSVKQ